jgi:hypothetical protein
MKIFLFSRGIRSGKTTELAQWCAGRDDVDGILMPDIGRQRYFRQIRDGSSWAIDSIEKEGPFYSEATLMAGSFRFSAQAIQRANFAIGQMAPYPHWLLIDEIGKLELRGDGFAPALRRLLLPGVAGPECLLLVVRGELVADVQEEFGLQQACIIDSPGGL